jgi:hypothetical protein
MSIDRKNDLSVVDDFQLDTAWVAEKDRIVAGAICVFAWRVENLSAIRLDLSREFINLGAAVGAKRYLAKTHAPLVKCLPAKPLLRR